MAEPGTENKRKKRTGKAASVPPDPTAAGPVPETATAPAGEETGTAPAAAVNPGATVPEAPVAPGTGDAPGAGPAPATAEPEIVEDPVEILVGLAERGEIDPWNIDIIEVTDRFPLRTGAAPAAQPPGLRADALLRSNPPADEVRAPGYDCGRRGGRWR